MHLEKGALTEASSYEIMKDLTTTTVTLIISTYRRPDALGACLASIIPMSRRPDEIIIADDGSDKEETLGVVRRYSRLLAMNIKLAWHEDKGFRLAKIRNRAIAASTCDYIIQVDGDEVMHPDFIADHLRWAKRGYFTKGTRVMIGEELTREICNRKEDALPKLTPRMPGLTDSFKGYRIRPLAWWFANFFKQRVYYALGGNMAFWRDDLMAINGYNESFEGWGREDDDIAHRLGRHGLLKRDLRFTAVCYHLWHPENKRSSVEANDAILKEQDRLGIIRCKKGVDHYLK